jgi:hypothetical protein
MKTAAKTIAARAIDDVRGVVIGGDSVQAALFYDGRQQGSDVYADSDQEAVEKCKAMRDERVKELGGHPCYLYQEPELWEVRIYDRL